MRLTLNFFLGFIVRVAHRTQRPLPYPHHFIHCEFFGIAWVINFSFQSLG
jgi:hypothetical protein